MIIVYFFVNSNKNRQKVNLQSMERRKRYQPYQQGANKTNRHDETNKLKMLANVAAEKAIQIHGRKFNQVCLASNNNRKFLTRNNAVEYIKLNFAAESHSLMVHSNKNLKTKIEDSYNDLTKNVIKIAQQGQKTYSKIIHNQQCYTRYSDASLHNNLKTKAHANNKIVNKALHKESVSKVFQNNFLQPKQSKKMVDFKTVDNQHLTKKNLFPKNIPNQYMYQSQLKLPVVNVANQNQLFMQHQTLQKFVPMSIPTHFHSYNKPRFPHASYQQTSNFYDVLALLDQIDNSQLIDSADKKKFRCSYKLLNLVGEGRQGTVFTGIFI